MIGGASVTGLEALFLGEPAADAGPGPRPSHGSPSVWNSWGGSCATAAAKPRGSPNPQGCVTLSHSRRSGPSLHQLLVPVLPAPFGGVSYRSANWRELLSGL